MKNNKEIKLLSFDLDGTLAPSRSSIDNETGIILRELSNIYLLAIITGGNIEQINSQVIDKLPKKFNYNNLQLMPTSGSSFYTYRGGSLTEIYKREINPLLREKIIYSLRETSKDLGIWEENSYGEIVEDRLSQITYSGLGQNAPLELKMAWDPDQSKRYKIIELNKNIFPNLDFRIGGSSSIDITLEGMDKAYAIDELLKYNLLEKDEVIFFGDRLQPGGNDYPVIKTGVETVAVNSYRDTIETLKQRFL